MATFIVPKIVIDKYRLSGVNVHLHSSFFDIRYQSDTDVYLKLRDMTMPLYIPKLDMLDSDEELFDFNLIHYATSLLHRYQTEHITISNSL